MNDFQDLVDRARQLRREGDPAAAVEVAREAVSARLEGAHAQLGLALREVGETGEAERVFREGLENGFMDVLIPLGNLLAETPGREREAEEIYRMAIADGERWAHLNLATSLADWGRDDEAEAEFQAAIESGDHAARRGYGIFLWERDRLREAEEQLEKALKGGDMPAHIDLGNVLADTGRVDEAEKHYRTAIELGADADTARRAYAQLLEELGRSDEAAAQLTAAEERPVRN